ncbi:hypothetical protein [Delftia tsuruhatensis]|uniref:hypothetical protein n=1 Tax=Delftia tsuruhatensis TaxID=180282 RepID=UPI001AE996DC
MTEAEYNAFRTALEDAFIALYVLDVGSLSSDQRLAHQQALSITYLAVVRAENKVLSELTASAKNKLAKIAEATALLQKQLAGLKKATEVLDIVAGALDTLTAITKLLK